VVVMLASVWVCVWVPETPDAVTLTVAVLPGAVVTYVLTCVVTTVLYAVTVVPGVYISALGQANRTCRRTHHLQLSHMSRRSCSQ